MLHRNENTTATIALITSSQPLVLKAAILLSPISFVDLDGVPLRMEEGTEGIVDVTNGFITALLSNGREVSVDIFEGQYALLSPSIAPPTLLM